VKSEGHAASKTPTRDYPCSWCLSSHVVAAIKAGVGNLISITTMRIEASEWR
jgi:hypothetical protein